MNKTLILRVASSVLALSIALGWFVAFRPTWLGGPASFVTVSGKSMLPTYRTGDLVVLHRHSSYKVGDIIAFRVEHGDVVIHRVVDGNGVSGYVTRGDNKDANDPWHPTNREVLGEAWFHAPSVGNLFHAARAPIPLSLLGGLLAGSVVGTKEHRRRRKYRRGWKKVSNRGFSDDGIPLWTAWAMVGAGVVFMVGIALAAQAWRTPVTRETLTSRSDYTSAGSFAYQADVTPSILYPDGKIGPVAPGASSAEAPPIYLASNPKITVDFEYSFTSLPGSTAKVQGEVESELIVRVAEKGWTKVVSLGQPLSFTGPSVGVPLTVDVPAVQTLIAEIERETNFRPATYQLVVAPTVHVAGTLDGAPVNEVFSPEYTFVLDRAQVIGDSPQTFERPHTIQTRAQVGTSVPWPLVAVPTVLGRFLALGLVFAALLAFCATAAYSLVGVGRVESARIRARYGSMLVSVRDTKFDVDPQKQIRLQSIGDLVKLARKDARMILHHVAPGGTHVYFIQDSDVTYLYVGESAGASAAPALSQA